MDQSSQEGLVFKVRLTEDGCRCHVWVNAGNRWKEKHHELLSMNCLDATQQAQASKH